MGVPQYGTYHCPDWWVIRSTVSVVKSNIVMIVNSNGDHDDDYDKDSDRDDDDNKFLDQNSKFLYN